MYSTDYSTFNNGQFICSASREHKDSILCVDISPLQSNNNNDNNKSNNIGVIGGNGYTICSGSNDKTIRICDIETTKQLVVNSGGVNIILSGSEDKSVRLWDIRSGQQIQAVNKHINSVMCVEYSSFVIKDSIGVVGGN
ncbi:hypothetical protein RFI_31683 [Reticulomyxa filosa]|uniref:Uncharacterized protein n=1 Tax=Reticulomyxa filosa TaxID=46433 RepID=X6LVQ7_RETFI|nr:hypothetical protein RFI_31683 [Reticulomyxa filosa]|eukprot:ETO05714.1 hypothetical protein RFI_31683 [Reticulomyxa filosa]